jgi:hypothetical protein
MRCSLITVIALAACGDNSSRSEPPLEDDPAVVRGCDPAPDSPEPFSRAKRVDCADELPHGLLVAGREGDILMENDRIQVVLRGGDEGFLYPASPPGGIIDAAPRGGDDLIKEIYPLIQLNVSDASEIALVEAGDDAPAAVVVRGIGVPHPFLLATLGTPPLGMAIETRYELAPGDAHLTMRTVVTAIPGQAHPGELQVGDLMLVSGHVAFWVPGAGVVDGVAAGPMVASSGSATTSYGVVYPDGGTMELNDLGVDVAAGARRAWDDPAPIERVLIIGDGSVSSVTDAGYALLGDTLAIAGTLAPLPPEASAWTDVAIEDPSGRAITLARAGADGAFEVAVPAGSYQVRAASAAHAPADVVEVDAGGAAIDVPLGDSGTLHVTVADSVSAGPLPARVMLKAPGEEAARILYADGTGELAMALPPGTYAVDVSRGVEYDAFSAVDLEVTAGATTLVAAVLERVVDTAGWIAIDTHLHSEMSSDSTIPLVDRLRAVAGEGVELAIATDHDFLTDYGPYLAGLSLEGVIAYRIGCEVSSRVWGHTNGWPLTPDLDRGGRGAFVWHQRSPAQIYHALHAVGPEVVVQVNHPRRTSSFFDAIDFDPDTVSARADAADLGLPPETDLDDFDFDAVEVANGKKDPFDLTFADWLALIAAGHPAAGTGSSDSHNASQFSGASRTYVYVGEGADDPASLDLDAVDVALRARKALVSQGAFVVAAIEDPGTGDPAAPGEMVDLGGETMARVHVRVQAPPWMPLATLRVYLGRAEAITVDLDPEDTAVVRYDDVIEVPLSGDGDSFVVVLVDPAAPGLPVLDDVGPSFTNPLLFDRDGNAGFDP